jgi:hypothetical protein
MFSLFIFLHFLHFEFCIFARRFTCFHLHLCCGFLHLIRVLFFFVFRCLCFVFVPCHVLYLCTFLLCRCALLLCFVTCCHTLLLVVTSCCSPRLVIHRCALSLTFAPCCLLSHLTTCFCALLFAFFFLKYLSPIVARLCSLLLCLFMSVSIPSPFSCASGGAWNNSNKLHSTS